MIRLAVDGMEEAIRQAVASRLRGAALVPAEEPLDGMVFLSPVQPETIRPLLAAEKPVLLCAPTWTTEGVAIANPDRYRPSRRLVKDELEAGKLGGVGLLRLHRWASTSDPTGLTRDLDLTAWLVSERPDRVYATSAPGLIQVHLSFPCGAMALLSHADTLPPGDGYQSLTVIGARGAAQADDHHDVQLAYRGGRPQAVAAGEGVRPYVALLQEFADAVRERRDLSYGVANWQGMLEVEAAVRQSLETRQAIALGKGGAA